MNNPIIVVILTLVAVVLIKLAVVLILSGGNIGRVQLAWRASLKLMRDQALADKVSKLLEPEPEKPAKPDGTPLRLLSVLQREGRLVDFLMEDITSATDEQIAAGIREIHRDCQHALKEHLDMEPVIAKPEGDTVEIPAGFDPSAIQLTGNVTGHPPFKGELRHAGWRVSGIKLAKPTEGVDELIVQPAEVELP